MMLSKILLSVCLIHLSVHNYLVHAKVQTWVNIHMPNALHHDGGYVHSMNHFGFDAIRMRQHGSMALPVVRAQSDLCSFDNTPKPNATPPFMLFATTGPSNCTFASKARHAQFLGAAGLLVGDDQCLCLDAGIYQCNATVAGAGDNKNCREEMPIVANDGSGSDISIPIVLLKKQDAEAVQTTMTQNKTSVVLDIRWRPKQDPVVNYGMWVDLYDNATVNLLKDLMPVALALENDKRYSYKTQFYPSFMLVNGSQASCKGNTGQDQCFQSCTNNGRYCIPSHHLPGAVVVQEILHRLCLWKHHGHEPDPTDHKAQRSSGEPWWNYVSYYDQNCRKHWWEYRHDAHQAASNLETCTEKAYKHAKIAKDEVKECINDSGGANVDTDERNVLLEQQLQAQVDYGLLTAPTAWANGQAIRWRPPSASSLLQSICQGFHDGVPDQNVIAPRVCEKCGHLRDDAAVLACAVKHHKKRHPVRTFFLVVFILMVVAAIGFFAYQKYVEGRDGSRLTSLTEGIRYSMLSDQNADSGVM